MIPTCATLEKENYRNEKVHRLPGFGKGMVEHRFGRL
jgi:hypothetical protein